MLAIDAQAQDGVGAAADEQLVDSLLRRNFLERLFGVDDGQRNENGARPRRDFVDVEVEPVGKKNDLRRNGGHGIVVVLAERAEIHLGEGVARDHAAVGQNPLAALGQARIVGADAHQLGGEIALDRERDVARTAGIDAPASIFVLVAHHLSERALQAAGIAAFEQRVQKDVVGLEHRVGFELAAPVAVGMLQGEEEIARAGDRRSRLGQIRVDSAKAGQLPNRLALRHVGFWLALQSCGLDTPHRLELSSQSAMFRCDAHLAIVRRAQCAESRMSTSSSI